MELRVIDFSKKHFECDGRKFVLKETLSFARYRELQKISLEFSFSASLYNVYKGLLEVWELLNKLKIAEAIVIIYNLMNGIVNLEEKDDPSLRICALFIDEGGEDPTVYDEGKMREKIECWGKELDVSPFFQLAASLVPGWINAYKTVSQDGLKEEKTEEQ